MINVAAIRMQQFGVRFYQASLTAEDIDKLVRFEVLSYGEAGQPVLGPAHKTSKHGLGVPTPSPVERDALARAQVVAHPVYVNEITPSRITTRWPPPRGASQATRETGESRRLTHVPCDVAF